MFEKSTFSFTVFLKSYQCANIFARIQTFLLTMLTVPPSDIDECFNSTVCGPDSICTNTPGAYECACEIGYEPTDPEQDPSETNICLGICTETLSGIEDPAVAPHSFPSHCLLSVYSVDIDECVKHDAICGPNANCTNTIGSYTCTCFSGYRLNNPSVIASYANPCTDIDECFETPGICGRQTICTNVPGTFYCSCPEGFFPSTGILWILGTSFCESELRMQSRYHLHSNTLMCQKIRTFLHVVGHLHLVAFSGSAAVAFLTLDGMESLLSHTYFKTENRTEMYSDVITAESEAGMVTCVYWEDKRLGEGSEAAKQKIMRWSVEGCGVAFTNENYTVCSCSHLSTFALILQISDFLEWLNRMCVIVGLFFFALAIFTFLLCSWNPKINNTARLHLCLNLGSSHLLLLWNDRYQEDELACTVMAGLLHFLVVASFVWMLLEALQLHLLVRRLSKVQVIQRDGLPRPLLYLIGYGVPFVIVGVSALIYSDGYGATEAKACWLSEKRHFNWALTGPVITVLGVSNKKISIFLKVIVFKILAQFVILGCTWILGLYQTNLFFQVLFIVLNSQQGTFLFIVHCLLNKEPNSTTSGSTC
uniref:Adhesion G protein-coupled receptor E8 n=1 Tax=Amphiprion percula TaxID=161767 RepID=A0A3P8SEB0_AMPPE